MFFLADDMIEIREQYPLNCGRHHYDSTFGKHALTDKAAKEELLEIAFWIVHLSSLFHMARWLDSVFSMAESSFMMGVDAKRHFSATPKQAGALARTRPEAWVCVLYLGVTPVVRFVL